MRAVAVLSLLLISCLPTSHRTCPDLPLPAHAIAWRLNQEWSDRLDKTMCSVMCESDSGIPGRSWKPSGGANEYSVCRLTADEWKDMTAREALGPPCEEVHETANSKWITPCCHEPNRRWLRHDYGVWACSMKPPEPDWDWFEVRPGEIDIPAHSLVESKKVEKGDSL